MNVLVLGAGILGTASAWFLRQAGHKVTVIERRDAAALETSFANGAQISVSHAEPWANPGAPRLILKWLGREDAPLMFRPRADLQQWRWALHFLRQCSASRTRDNARQLLALALYSQQTLAALRDELNIEYNRLALGILHLFTDQRDLEDARLSVAVLRERGVDAEFLDADQVIAREPALAAARHLLIGAIHAPGDESGDAYRFTTALAERAAQSGVVFRYATEALGLRRDGRRITSVRVGDAQGLSDLHADAVVVALGSWSAPLLRTVGIDTLIYPVKGYSATVPIRAGAAVNHISLTDHALKMVFSRLGNQLRIAGTAELTGYDLSLNPARCLALTRRAQQLFPDALEIEQAVYWAGLRPATPSNIPYIGRSKISNLWLNTGHGTLGWTHGAGSGRALAALMDGKRPDVAFRFCDHT